MNEGFEPYLSIVVTTRNDNHGGDLLRRTSCFVQGLLDQSKKYQLRTELIIVEWNPPADKPLLHEVLPKPGPGDFLTIKYILIPKELHQQYKHSDTIPLYQMIAKNVGIRRAEGAFVLCTNIDILFSDNCFARLAAQTLQSGKFYRANRCDVPKQVMDYPSLNEQLHYASKHIIRTLGKNTNILYLRNIPSFFYWFPNALKLLDRMWGILVGKKQTFVNVESLDLNACGDFTLMSKTDWEHIKGYVELDMYSIHIDSMGIMSAAAMGLEQVVFKPKEVVYHIDHADGWESDDPFKLLRFLASKPCLEWSVVARAGQKMITEKGNWNINSEDWGFKSYNLEVHQYLPS